MTQLPHTVAALIRQLDKDYPAKCIGPTEDPIAAHRYAGKRELIDLLLRLDEKQSPLQS